MGRVVEPTAKQIRGLRDSFDAQKAAAYFAKELG
jgi:hypothetical protein